MRQKHYASGFERVSDGLSGFGVWHATLQLKVVDLASVVIEAAVASLETDQLSNVRAERHCAAVIVIVDFLLLQKVAT